MEYILYYTRAYQSKFSVFSDLGQFFVTVLDRFWSRNHLLLLGTEALLPQLAQHPDHHLHLHHRERVSETNRRDSNTWQAHQPCAGRASDVKQVKQVLARLASCLSDHDQLQDKPRIGIFVIKKYWFGSGNMCFKKWSAITVLMNYLHLSSSARRSPGVCK